MTQYINKAAVVAEMERRRDLHYKHYMKNGAGSIAECKYDEDREILSFLYTLEVKEVDLKEEVQNYLKLHNLHIADGGRIVFQGNGMVETNNEETRIIMKKEV